MPAREKRAWRTPIPHLVPAWPQGRAGTSCFPHLNLNLNLNPNRNLNRNLNSPQTVECRSEEISEGVEKKIPVESGQGMATHRTRLDQRRQSVPRRLTHQPRLAELGSELFLPEHEVNRAA